MTSCAPRQQIDGCEKPHQGSELLSKVVLPALANAEEEFGVALSRINVEDMAHSAEKLN